MLSTMSSLPTNSSVDSEELSLLVTELQELGYDAIRFSSYRTAKKLRFIQTRSKFILIDIFNVIEGIRENGLNSLDPYSILSVAKLENVVTSLYVNLNKRLPQSQLVDVTSCARYLLSWMLIAYDNDGCSRGLRVFQVKVFLSTLCSGKLLDKLRYIFSQISDENGNLVLARFQEYLQEVLAIPVMVLEANTFAYTDGLAETIFSASDGTTNDASMESKNYPEVGKKNTQSRININQFLDALLDPGPPCIVWLSVLHSMAAISSLSHGVKCSICHVNNIQGFRYKCIQCRPNLNLCQDCYWQGKSTGSHLANHEVKEYSTTKSGGSFRHSFRKSLRCVPDKQSKQMPRFQQERPLNLAHIVPPSPLPSHNGFPIYEPLDAYSDIQKMIVMENYCPNKQFAGSYSGDSVSESDEEHKLIARYTARLASENKYPPAPTMYKHSRAMSQSSMHSMYYDTTQTQRDMINQLEARNREIMNEIARLRAQQEMEYLSSESHQGPILMEELQALRYHKSELEDKLNNLHDSRQHLMGQLESLMKLLKAQNITPKSSPSSPRSTKSPPTSMSIYSGGSLPLHRSAPVTPHHSDTFTSLTGELRSAFSSGTEDRDRAVSAAGSYSNNSRLLVCCDSVTNALSTLVKELNGSDEENIADAHIMKPLDYEDDANFLAELRARRQSSNENCGQSCDRDGTGGTSETFDSNSSSSNRQHSKQNEEREQFPELYDDFKDLHRLSGFPLTDAEVEPFLKTDEESVCNDWEDDDLRRWNNR